MSTWKAASSSVLFVVSLVLVQSCNRGGTGGNGAPLAKETSALGGLCGLVPAEYVNANDGCDCPADGDTSCDPDCADGNNGGGFCGCEYCYGDPNLVPYVPPAVGAALGIPATPPVTTPAALVAPALVGELPGDGGVTVNGAFEYELPIDVLSGRAGMQPSISLGYHSRGGGGLLGVGWSLKTGASVITRCPAHFSSGSSGPVPGDRRQTAGVQYALSDQLCLDGQKLALKAGTYGAPGSEYRTENDAFAKIVAGTTITGGAPDVFTIYSKDGLISRYELHGGLPAHQYYTTSTNSDGSFGGSGNAVIEWTLVRRQDRSGNSVDYVWDTLGDYVFLPRLKEIRYTSCTGTCPYGTAPPRRVAFTYENRPDWRTQYQRGVLFESRVRLKLIEMFTKDQTGAESKVWDYTLGYKVGALSSRSLLETVKRCDAQGACLPQTKFTWQDGAGVSYGVQGFGSNAYTDALVQPGRVGVANTGELNASEVTFVVLDVDGDGNKDILVKSWPASALDATTRQLVQNSSTTNGWREGPVDRLLLGDGHGYFQPATNVDLENDGDPQPMGQARYRCATNATPQTEVADFSSAIAVDLDMDGREELFAPLSDGCHFYVAQANVSPGVDYGVRITPRMRQIPYNNLTVSKLKWGVLGLSRSTGKLVRYTNTAVPFGFPSTYPWQLYDHNFADFTGDGLPDVVFGSRTTGGESYVYASYSTGTGTTEAANPEFAYVALIPTAPPHALKTRLDYSWQPVSPTLPVPNVSHVLDENGDGRDELVQFSYDGSRRSFGLNATSDAIEWRYRQGFDNCIWDSCTLKTVPVTDETTTPNWGAPTGNIAQLNAYAMAERSIDINGDGLRDFMVPTLEDAGGVPGWSIRINTGRGYLHGRLLGNRNVLDAHAQTRAITLNGTSVRVPMDTGLRVADMNDDGMEDLVLLNTPTGSVMYSNGTDFAAPVALPSRTGSAARLVQNGNSVAFPASQLADLNGDGLTDLVEFVGDPSDATKRRLITVGLDIPGGIDVITTVTDGRSTAAAQSIVYGNLSNPAVHLSDATPRYSGSPAVRTSPVCRYPARCVATGAAVTRFTDHRAAGDVDLDYHYAGARVDVAGAGWLGFRQSVEHDRVSGFDTTMTFDPKPFGDLFAGSPYSTGFQVYPLMSRPKQVVTEQTDPAVHDASLATPAGGRARLTTTWTPAFTSYPVRMFIDSSETVVADASGSLTSPTITPRSRFRYEATFDDYGNTLMEQSIVTDEGQLELGSTPPNSVHTEHTIATTYVPPDTTNWLVALPQLSTVTSTSDDATCAGISGCANVVQTTQFAYESAARKLLSKITREPSGSADKKLTTVLERDAAGIVRRTRLQDSAGVERVSEVDFDQYGIAPTIQRNAKGQISFSLYHFKVNGLDRTTDANGLAAASHYDTFGRRTDTSSDGHPTTTITRANDASGTYSERVQHSTTPGWLDKKTFYDQHGRPMLTVLRDYSSVANTDAATSVTVRNKYDVLGNVIQQSFRRLAQSYATSMGMTYTALLAAHTNGGGDEILSATDFDSAGRVVGSIRGDRSRTTGEGAGEISLYQYPRVGEFKSTDPLGHEYRTIRDARGRIRRAYFSRTSGATPSVSSDFVYSALGQLARVKTSNAPAEVFLYDNLGRNTEWQLAESPQKIQWAYSAFDQVARVTKPTINSIAFVYDQLGRPLTRTEDANSAVSERSIQYEWDNADLGSTGRKTVGALGRAKVVGGTTSEYTYDALARPATASEIYDDGQVLTMSYAYDAASRLDTIQYPSFDAGGTTVPGLVIQNKFATNGELRKIVEVSNFNAVLWEVTARHPLGMTKQAINDDSVTNDYDYQVDTGRLKTHNLSAAGVSTNQTFGYLANGELGSRAIGRFSETYGYNLTGHRLSNYHLVGNNGSAREVEATYGYDNAGNITGVTTTKSTGLPAWPAVGSDTLSYGAGSTLGGTQAGFKDLLTSLSRTAGTTTTTFAYGYDAAGRQTHQFVNGTLKRRINSYNTYNLPTTVSLQNGATVLSTTTLDYDAHGNRTEKSKVTPAAGTTEDIRYFGKLFEAQDVMRGSTRLRRSLFRVYAEGAPVAEIFYDVAGGAASYQYLLTDYQGSVTARYEGSTAKDGGETGYFPFGRRWQPLTDTPSMSSLGYTGHVHDDDLGFINMNGRVFDTEQQRFISRDPMLVPQELGGTNAYSYVSNNPMNMTDPSGFCGQEQDSLNPGSDQCPPPDPGLDCVVTTCETIGDIAKAAVNAPGWVANHVVKWFMPKAAKPSPPKAPKVELPPPFHEPPPQGPFFRDNQQGVYFGDDVATPPPSAPSAPPVSAGPANNPYVAPPGNQQAAQQAQADSAERQQAAELLRNTLSDWSIARPLLDQWQSSTSAGRFGPTGHILGYHEEGGSIAGGAFIAGPRGADCNDYGCSSETNRSVEGNHFQNTYDVVENGAGNQVRVDLLVHDHPLLMYGWSWAPSIADVKAMDQANVPSIIIHGGGITVMRPNHKLFLFPGNPVEMLILPRGIR